MSDRPRLIAVVTLQVHPAWLALTRAERSARVAALAPVLMASPDNEIALLTRAHIANSRAATTFFGSDMQRADQEYQRAQAILEPLATRGVRGATQALLVTLTGLGDVAYWTDQYSTAIAH